jgi:thioredoxin 1
MKTVYYFTADWCQPCKRTRPIVEELSREQITAMFQVIDVDDNSTLANNFMIQSIPTFVLFEDGIEKNRITGAQTRESLMDFING